VNASYYARRLFSNKLPDTLKSCLDPHELITKMSDSLNSKFSNQHILSFLTQNYQLTGSLKELPSYSDLNLVLKTDDGLLYVIKIASNNDTTVNLEMQNKAMQHLYDQSLAVPRVINNIHGANISSIVSAQGAVHNLRVLSYLQGKFYADTQSETHGEVLWLDLGEFLGKVDCSLQDFQHQGAHRFLEWDLSQGLGICQSKKHLLQPAQFSLVKEFLKAYQIHALPRLGECPQGIIHNDANDYNLLVDNVDNPKRITGLIDFGDMLFSHLINEIAIACAYAILQHNDPLQVIKEIVRGYHRHRKLRSQEIRVLYYLIALRLCTTLCNAAFAIQKEPDNDYLLVSVQPADEALKKLKAISAYSVELQLLEICGLAEEQGSNHQKIIEYRQKHLARSLSLSYQQPLKIVRGEGCYLYDEKGNAYLDMVNNVCHVGHCHPDVVLAGQTQMAQLNTNTRYLHDNIVNYSEKLLATFPPSLSVCMFVNSGSEANELAFRLARCYSGSKELIVVDGAYHGNTAACINASPYKFDGPGGKGAEAYVHKVVLPDPYRGKYLGYDRDIGQAYAEDVTRAIAEIEANGNNVGAFICESLQGVAGQIIMPAGYLNAVYEKVRATGGVCIADEVQVGFGRVGNQMWAFETQQVVPDIITLGKPIGNGHPLAAVLMTKEIADTFHNGMEYFNTFGGNPVSCAIGEAVLDVVQNESLANNAQQVGTYMMENLQRLQQQYELIGDVRGVGLFVGVELVDDRESKQPATKKMKWLTEHFRRNNILLTPEGPFYNVLKIKPPIVFSRENVELFIKVFECGLIELKENPQ